MAGQSDIDIAANRDVLAVDQPLTIYTIGHSTRPIEEFIGILQAYGLQQVVDVRRIPRSRANPQFSEEALGASLAGAQIGYQRLEALGGLRHSRADSPNTGWRNASFRAYADYMLTPVFHEALTQLMALASTSRTVIMCAEAVPWRCHRSLLADALTARGVTVFDLFSRTQRKLHVLPAMAHFRDGQIYYEQDALPAHGGTA